MLSLPVSTQIAQVRGYDGYGFPKWVTGLDVSIGLDRTAARISNDAGGVDLALSAATPRQAKYETGERVSTLTSYTSLGGAWHSTLSQTNVLSAGTARFPRGANLQVGQGRMADDLRALKPIKTIQLDVVTEGQLALHMPVPVSVRDCVGGAERWNGPDLSEREIRVIQVDGESRSCVSIGCFGSRPVGPSASCAASLDIMTANKHAWPDPTRIKPV